MVINEWIKLIKMSHIQVFMNCSGFIKIDTVRIQERTDAYVEVSRGGGDTVRLIDDGNGDC